MSEIIDQMMTQGDMVLLMVTLSLLIKIYKYFSSADTKHSLKSFILTVWRDLISDAIIILTLWIIDVYVIAIDPAVMLIGITFSDQILEWIIHNEHKITSRLMNKIINLIIEELKNLSKSNEDEEISSE
jgi:hypothetical protein